MIRFLPPAALVALALVLGYAPATQAEEMTGNRLLQICTDKAPGSVGYCRGYVLGMASGTFGWTEGPSDASIPVGVSDSQLVDIVMWLKDNPKARHIGANLLMAVALADAFPAQPKAAAKR